MAQRSETKHGRTTKGREEPVDASFLERYIPLSKMAILDDMTDDEVLVAKASLGKCVRKCQLYVSTNGGKVVTFDFALC